MADTGEEVRGATSPGAWSQGGAPPAAKASGGTVVGLNAPMIPEYSAHDKLQTSHRGQYSIERMLALHDYCQRVSWVRAVAVCVVTPVPSIAIAILLQLFKVKKYNPFLWSDNTPFWVLTSILSLIFATSVTIQAAKMLKSYPISIIKGLIISVVTATAMVLILYGVAKAWMFPVPFTFVLGMAPFVVIWFLTFGLLVRHKPFPLDVGGATTAMPPTRFFAFLVVQMAMIAAFVGFEILLLQLETKVLAQKITFLLYQSIRNIFKHTAACYLLRHVQDFVPELVVFSVELFVSWFMVFELLVAYDESRTVAVLGTLLLSALTAMIHLNKRLKKLHALREKAALPKNGGECLQSLVDALQRPHLLDQSVLKDMRLRGTGGHDLPSEMAAIVDNLQTMPAFIPSPDGGVKKSSGGGASVAPVVAPVDGAAVTGEATDTSKALHQTLVVLFNSEYLVLVKYVETLAPLLYIIFVYVVFDNNMANLISYPYLMMMKIPVMKAIHHDVGIHALLLIAMQVFLAVLLVVQLKWKRLGVSPLHQLAFVLENQQLQIQAKLVPYMLFAVHFVMFHYGSDFHLNFAWKAYFK